MKTMFELLKTEIVIQPNVLIPETSSRVISPLGIGAIAGVVGAVFGLGSFLSELRQEETIEKIMEKLDEVSGDVKQIKKMLDDTYAELIRLGIRIDKIPYEITRSKLNAQINVVYQNLPLWITDKTAAMNELPGFRLNFETVTNEMMEYGYAQFVQVIYAMIYDILIMQLLEYDVRLLKRRLQAYIDYLNTGLNPAELQTPAEKLAGVNQKIAVLETFHSTEILAQVYHRSRRDEQRMSDGILVCTFDVSVRIDGDLANGYKRGAETEKGTGCRFYPKEWPPKFVEPYTVSVIDENGVISELVVEGNTQQTDGLRISRTSQVDGYLKQLNADHARYLDLLNQRAELEDAIAAANDAIAKIEALMM